MTGVYVDDIEEDFFKTASISAIQFAVVLFIVCGLGWYLAKQIVNPLECVSQLMEKAGTDKNLTYRCEIQNRSETGLIATSLNYLLEQFQDSIKKITDTSLHLSDESQGLAASSEQTRIAISSQAIQIEQIATAVNQMTATVEEVAQNTVRANNQTQRVDDLSKRGVSIVNHTVEEITKLADEVEKVAEAINSLQQEAQGIGDIVGVITGIAEQVSDHAVDMNTISRQFTTS